MNLLYCKQLILFSKGEVRSSCRCSAARTIFLVCIQFNIFYFITLLQILHQNTFWQTLTQPSFDTGTHTFVGMGLQVFFLRVWHFFFGTTEQVSTGIELHCSTLTDPQSFMGLCLHSDWGILVQTCLVTVEHFLCCLLLQVFCGLDSQIIFGFVLHLIFKIFRQDFLHFSFLSSSHLVLGTSTQTSLRTSRHNLQCSAGLSQVPFRTYSFTLI